MVILEGSSFRNEELKRERERDEARERVERKQNDDAIKAYFVCKGRETNKSYVTSFQEPSPGLR